jgi:hypothetical protein
VLKPEGEHHGLLVDLRMKYVNVKSYSRSGLKSEDEAVAAGIDRTSTLAPRGPGKLSICVCSVGLRRVGWVRLRYMVRTQMIHKISPFCRTEYTWEVLIKTRLVGDDCNAR